MIQLHCTVAWHREGTQQTFMEGRKRGERNKGERKGRKVEKGEGDRDGGMKEGRKELAKP